MQSFKPNSVGRVRQRGHRHTLVADLRGTIYQLESVAVTGMGEGVIVAQCGWAEGASRKLCEY